ncbi:hypothetical protein [Alteromonas macleodii]|uniref:hypothetical protein n=1 Tax=Alteromonas macleodii TaxID=28108 RepID=UPI00313FF6D4|tara:strand:+ start:19488 stop:19853 length:366 start_codon:yes stop_codon:yes gene_type:complete
MNPEIVSGKGLCGQSVPVLKHDGQEKNVHFAGFVDIAEIKKNNGVMLKNVEAYTKADSMGGGEWIEYAKDEVLLGYEGDEGVFLVLVGGKPFSLGGGVKKEVSGGSGVVVDIANAHSMKRP